jgi:hypothetical protein
MFAAAESYIASYGWGAAGKHMSIGRILSDNDVAHLSRGRYFTATRPRGLLSGFLAIVPHSSGVGVFLPNPLTRKSPMTVRLRLSESVRTQGAVFSAYVTNDRQICLEDVLVWTQTPVWSTRPFSDRWDMLRAFLTEQFTQDVALQGGYTLRPATYGVLDMQTPPAPNTVVEFVPNVPSQKRFIWLVPAAAAPAAVAASTATAAPAAAAPAPMVAKKEATAGPDVYSVWKGEERLGQALVRTLAVSRALRLAAAESEAGSAIPVRAEWNAQFGKIEILAVV